MPGTYTFVDGVTRMTLVDNTSLPDLERLVDQVLADPRCPPVTSGLLDLRRSSSVSARSADEIATGVHIFGERGDRFRKLAVVATYGDRFAVTRAAEQFAEGEGIEVRVFTGEAEATEWLHEEGASERA